MDGTLLDDAARQAAIVQLNVIVETELAGTVRYTHYALMVYGYNRIPIVSWLRSNAAESLAHAQRALRPGARLRVWSMPDAERRSAPPAPPIRPAAYSRPRWTADAERRSAPPAPPIRPGACSRPRWTADAERRSAPPAPPFDTERVAAPGGRLTQNAGARHPRPPGREPSQSRLKAASGPPRGEAAGVAPGCSGGQPHSPR